MKSISKKIRKSKKDLKNVIKDYISIKKNLFKHQKGIPYFITQKVPRNKLLFNALGKFKFDI